MRLSVVTTLYRSARHLAVFHRRAAAAAEGASADVEFIYVNDGSPDDSVAVARELQREDRRITVVDLSRNFGHHKAIVTGLAHATGDRVFLLDSDLEEPPEILPELLAAMDREEADVAYAVQRQRKGGGIERIAGALYYRLFNALSPHPVPANLMTARVMSRRYVDALLAHREREVCLSGLWAATGFRQVGIPADKASRGGTTYTFGKRLANLVDGITSFSNRPLLGIFFLGSFVSAASLVAAGWLVARKLFFGDYLAGWPSLIVSVWLLGGLILFCMGILGIYVAKLFSEVKRRPYTIVREVYRAGNDDAGPVHPGRGAAVLHGQA